MSGATDIEEGLHWQKWIDCDVADPAAFPCLLSVATIPLSKAATAKATRLHLNISMAYPALLR